MAQRFRKPLPRDPSVIGQVRFAILPPDPDLPPPPDGHVRITFEYFELWPIWQ